VEFLKLRNFHFFNLNKISGFTECFIPSSMGNKNIFMKKIYEVTGSVKFFAMQQNNATLIYDLDKVKDTMEL